MELDGKHGVEEARRGDEEHGEKRDELEGGQVYARSLGLEVDEGTTRGDPPFFFFFEGFVELSSAGEYGWTANHSDTNWPRGVPNSQLDVLVHCS
ncbi:hypothetical protein ACFX2F_012713 [Malus domestica]